MLPVGNTCSPVLPAGPVAMELWQPCLDWAMGSAAPNNFACNGVCGAAGNKKFPFMVLHRCPHNRAKPHRSQEYLCKREKEKTRRCWNEIETTIVMTI